MSNYSQVFKELKTNPMQKLFKYFPENFQYGSPLKENQPKRLASFKSSAKKSNPRSDISSEGQRGSTSFQSSSDYRNKAKTPLNKVRGLETKENPIASTRAEHRNQLRQGYGVINEEGEEHIKTPQQTRITNPNIQNAPYQKQDASRVTMSGHSNELSSNKDHASSVSQMSGDRSVQPFNAVSPQTVSEHGYSNYQNPGDPGETDLMGLLREYAHCQLLCSQFKNAEAIKALKSLPGKHKKTGWALTRVGEAFMELQKYNEAEKVFLEQMNLEPQRLEGLDMYSICLWRLKKQVDLCKLSNQALGRS